ncbi:HigA family addiction module antitoxin [Gryllotalpicola ginsengisoli]|uniref:HigA family addiction module antitoxin n=1 Tax=Gryllotalpicola ginsengisoli TaxID=444608 RepID=UPI0003B47F00|nr:HigA family addiction module antitoxin [Gryllotalpicola ginsengisoli]
MSNSSTITDDLSTPGETLLKEFLEPFGMTQHELATSIGVDRSKVSRIIRGQQAITADIALRLSAVFGTSPQFWLRLQEGYDLARARETTEIDGIEPVAISTR